MPFDMPRGRGVHLAVSRVSPWMAHAWRRRVFGGAEYLAIEPGGGGLGGVYRVSRIDPAGRRLATFLGSARLALRTTPVLGALERGAAAAATASLPLASMCESARLGLLRRDAFLQHPNTPSPHWAMTLDLFAAPDPEPETSTLVVCQLLEMGEQTLLDWITTRPREEAAPRLRAWLWQLNVTMAAESEGSAWPAAPSSVMIQDVQVESRYHDVDWIYVLGNGEAWRMRKEVHGNTMVKILDHGVRQGNSRAEFYASPEWPPWVRDPTDDPVDRVTTQPSLGMIVMGADEGNDGEREKKQRLHALFT
jgi:hypothetical protein